MPYVQYEGVVLSLYCSSLGAQSCRGAYKPSSSEGMVLYHSYVWWIPPFILQGGPPIYIASTASVCCLIAVVDSLPL